MADEKNETPAEENPGSGEEQKQTPPAGTGGEEEKQQPTTLVIDKDTKLPDDHPLVKTLAAQKDELGKAKDELTELRAKSKKVTELETALNERPTQEAVDTLQTRYDRLEGFLQAMGGPISKALDSRTFTKDLFETDKKIEDIVKDYAKANPTATSTALGAAGSASASGKIDPNTLLRAAAAK